MNLHFGICWIEDQASDAEVEAVEEAIRNGGFEPNIERVENENQIAAFAARQHHFQDYDLILLDLRLGGGIRGDELAPIVRNAFRSTPILFYSAEAEENLRRMMARNLVDGVYCVHRDRLATRVSELVANLSPALNRLSTMRGLAARVVAECDRELRVVLSHLAGQGHEAAIVASLKARLAAAGEAQLRELEPIEDLPTLLRSHAVTSGALYNEARDRARNLGDEVRDILRSMRDYPNQILGRRNTLAHALEERTENGWRIVRDGAPDLTVGDFQRYRRDFLARLQDVRRLRQFLIGE